MNIDTKGFICLATGASASLNSTWFWTCEECGAGITTSANYVGDTPLRIHREWHAKRDAAYAARENGTIANIVALAEIESAMRVRP